jgi:hypothetical protein
MKKGTFRLLFYEKVDFSARQVPTFTLSSMNRDPSFVRETDEIKPTKRFVSLRLSLP